jgi:hypothetical protein
MRIHQERVGDITDNNELSNRNLGSIGIGRSMKNLVKIARF